MSLNILAALVRIRKIQDDLILDILKKYPILYSEVFRYSPSVSSSLLKSIKVHGREERMEKFVSDLLKKSDLSILTKRMVRDAYKEHIGSDHLSTEERNGINGIVNKLLDKITVQFQLQDSADDGENKEASREESTSVSQVSPPKVIGDVMNTKQEEETNGTKDSPVQSKESPRSSLSPRLNIDEAVNAVMLSDNDNNVEEESDEDVSDESDEEEDEKTNKQQTCMRMKRRISLDSESDTEYEPFKDETESLSRLCPKSKNTYSKKSPKICKNRDGKSIGTSKSQRNSKQERNERKRRRIMIESDSESSISDDSDESACQSVKNISKHEETRTGVSDNSEGDQYDSANSKSPIKKRRKKMPMSDSENDSDVDNEDISRNSDEETINENSKNIVKSNKRSMTIPSDSENSSDDDEEQEKLPSKRRTEVKSKRSPEVKVTSDKKPEKHRKSGDIDSHRRKSHDGDSEGQRSHIPPKKKTKGNVKISKSHKKENLKPSDSSGVSSDSEMDDSLSKKSTEKKKDGKIQETNSNSKMSKQVTNLKKICRAVGIFVKEPVHLAGCKTDSKKVKRLKEILQNAGMEGQPSMKKVQDLNLKKELNELGSNNILQTNGSRKRRCNSVFARYSPSPKKQFTPQKNMFSRLKDIIDSEESD